MRVSSEERKGQLIAAAVELMRREGVQSVTIRAIATEGNSPLATAHYCFSNKEELMDAAAEAWLKNLSRFSSNVPVHLGLRKAVEQVAEGYWRALEEEPASILSEIELIRWAARNATVSPLAAKITLPMKWSWETYSLPRPKAAAAAHQLKGGAFLQVTAHSPSYDSTTGKATFVPANRSEVTNVSKDQTFRQVVWAGSFEGYTALGLGVRARLPFKVYTLAGPGNGSKLVIDAARQWRRQM